jgi:sugar phosphate isomerase/epimerase
MHPRLSANVSMVRDWDLGQCIETWSRVGIPGIGITISGLDAYGRRRGIRHLKDAGLRVTNYQLFTPYQLQEPEKFRERLAPWLEYLDVAAELEAECLYTLFGPREKLSWDEAARRVVEQTLEILPAVHERGLRLALEPLSPMRQEYTFLTLAADTLDLLAQIDDPAVGYVFDFYHLWWQRGIAEIARRSASQVFSVQVSDHKPVTLRYFDRGMLGEGLIPLRELLRALIDGGYAGHYDLEIISEDTIAMGFENALRRSAADFDRLWESL